MKTLIIAEKPDMGRTIASVLEPKAANKRTYIEGERYLITWAIGHLIGLAEPDHYDPKYKKWSFQDLPIIPDRFLLLPNPRTREQLKVIAEVAKGCDRIVNACDAGREGQLIFSYIQQHLKLRQPVQRLWISDLTAETIRRGFAELKDGSEYENLTQAARARSEADWLIGMNGSRAFTTKHNELLSVGRVQTPVLALIYDRQKQIEAFDSEKFFEVEGEFKQGDTTYKGMWQGGRLPAQEPAEAVVRRVKGRPGRIASYEVKETKEYPFKLYDLTLLQREANGKYGFSAKKTLDTAQALYEKHKVISYPRTNSNYVNPENIPEMHKSLDSLRGTADYGELVQGADKRLVHTGNKSICNPAKVEDHHAILPTGKRPNGLNADEQKVYDLVVRRFLAHFYPHAAYRVHTLVTEIDSLSAAEAGEPQIGIGGQEASAGEEQGLEQGQALREGQEPGLALREGQELGLALREGQELGRVRNLGEVPGKAYTLPSPPDSFKTTVKELLQLGWKILYPDMKQGGGSAGKGKGRGSKSKDASTEGGADEEAGGGAAGESQLETDEPFGLDAGAPVRCTKAAAKEKETQPPKAFTEGTLLKAMESAGKQIEDDELRDAMKDSGLGTPATRAATIERLKQVGYIDMQGKKIVLAPKGRYAIELIRGAGVDLLTSPEMTGRWERRLNEIARGQASGDAFMNNVKAFAQQIIDRVRGQARADKALFAAAEDAPRRGGAKAKTTRSSGRRGTQSAEGGSEAAAAAEPKAPRKRAAQASAAGGARAGGAQAAIAPPPPAVQERQAQPAASRSASPTPAAEREALGTCPRPGCGGSIFFGRTGYGCTHYKQGCSFVIWKESLGVSVTADMVRQLLRAGHTLSPDGRQQLRLVIRETGQVELQS